MNGHETDNVEPRPTPGLHRLPEARALERLGHLTAEDHSMPEAAPLPFALTIEDLGATTVVRCHGKLLAEHVELLYGPVLALLPTHERLILDLAGLTQMDSMGLGALVRIYVSARHRGCTLELSNLGKKVRDLLVLTNLLPAFTAAGEYNIRV